MLRPFDNLNPEVYFPVYGINPALGVKEDIFLDEYAYRMPYTDVMTAPIRTDINIDLKLLFAASANELTYKLDDYRLILRKLIYQDNDQIIIETPEVRVMSVGQTSGIAAARAGMERGTHIYFSSYHEGRLSWERQLLRIPSWGGSMPQTSKLLGYEIALVQRELCPPQSSNIAEPVQ